jgi:hypothetical protein
MKAFPSELDALIAWVNRFGDHFAGDCPAQMKLLAEVASIHKMEAILVKEHAHLSTLHKRALQVCYTYQHLLCVLEKASRFRLRICALCLLSVVKKTYEQWMCQAGVYDSSWVHIFAALKPKRSTIGRKKMHTFWYLVVHITR